MDSTKLIAGLEWTYLLVGEISKQTLFMNSKKSLSALQLEPCVLISIHTCSSCSCKHKAEICANAYHCALSGHSMQLQMFAKRSCCNQDC